MPQTRRIGFVTCVQLGLSCIEEIVAAGGGLDCIVTLRDSIAPRKSGRVFLDEFCRHHEVLLFKVGHIDEDAAIEFLESRCLDWLFIIGWSQIAGSSVLQAPNCGVLGMHPTLLPQGRGRAAIPWTILKGLRETGVTLFQLDSRVDAGPIMLQHRLPVADTETATTLYEKVARGHRLLMRAAWPLLMNDRLEGKPQDDAAATYWPGRTPADGRIDQEMTVEEIDRLVRATTHPYPGAFVLEPDKVLRVWAGVPARGGSTRAGAYRIPCRGGAFDALDFQIEPRVSPEATTPPPSGTVLSL